MERVAALVIRRFSLLISCTGKKEKTKLTPSMLDVRLAPPDSATCRILRSRWILLDRDHAGHYSLNTEPKDSVALDHWIRARLATFPESIRVLVIAEPVASDTATLRWILADLTSAGARGVAVDWKCAPPPVRMQTAAFPPSSSQDE
jgi:hypothetical protein